jgi:hypothetical protein
MIDTENETTSTTPRQQLAPRPGPLVASISTRPLLPAQRDVLRQALADAVFYRDPPVYCPDCQTPDRLCSQCAAGLSQARAYLALSHELETSPDGLESLPVRLA